MMGTELLRSILGWIVKISWLGKNIFISYCHIFHYFISATTDTCDMFLILIKQVSLNLKGFNELCYDASILQYLLNKYTQSRAIFYFLLMKIKKINENNVSFSKYSSFIVLQLLILKTLSARSVLFRETPEGQAHFVYIFYGY